MNPLPGVAADFETLEYHDAGQRWTMAWHPPSATPPGGKRHGSVAVCVTPDGLVVFGSEEGAIWQLPGGRPEGTADWRQTLDREVTEEACAKVETATLLGYARSECTFGREVGLVLVRSLWRAEVTLHEWQPRFEMRYRRLVSPDDAIALVDREPHPGAIYRRLFYEAFGRLFP